MKRRGLLAAAGGIAALAGTSGVAHATGRPYSTLFHDGFEGADFSAWTRQRIDGNGTMGMVTDPVLAGSQAARFTVPNDGESYRSEVAKDPFDGPAFRYRFANFLPSDWVPYEYGTILAQWHGYPLADGSDTNPPISLNVKQTYWQLKVHRLADDGSVQETTLDLPDVTFGRWNRWSVDITWSTSESPGAITVRLDDAVVATHTGVNNYDQAKTPYFKLGIYRANWNPAKGIDYPTGGPDVVVYDDEVSIESLPAGIARTRRPVGAG